MRSIDSLQVPSSARGDVVLSLVRGSSRIPFVARHNTVSYSAADAIAAAYGGDSALVPKYIGFIYGDSSSPTGLSPVSDRNIRWADLRDEMADITGNILISRFTSTPEIGKSDPPEASDAQNESSGDPVYTGNTVTFRACTRSGEAGEYAFDTTPGSGFAGEFDDGKYLYHAVLLGDARSSAKSCSSDKEYIVLGRVSLKKGSAFRKKPSDYELALDWKVSFF